MANSSFSSSDLKNAPLKHKMPDSWDVEVCHEGEDNLYKRFKSCRKHPSHKEFIPVNTFDITDLPVDYQDTDIVEYIKRVAQLTVRLTVRYVSPKRPATVPGTEIPYPFYENRGQNVTIVGTGMITDVRGIRIAIKTATHVVFDKIEAKNTSFHLFYDKGNRPALCKTAIELKGTISIVSNTITDEAIILIFLRSHLCPKSVVNKITQIFFKMSEVRKKILKGLPERSDDRQNKPEPLIFIVSHPHGCSKKISIGGCVEVDDNLDDVRFLYTTPTCPGSSGAAVNLLDKRAWNLNGIHNGVWKHGKSLNIGSGRYSPLERVGDLYDEIKECNDRRLPNSKCSLDYLLPRELNYNLMHDYIITWSKLCVFLGVNYTSEQRPEFWPGSEFPYPWYKERGSREARRGWGWVDRVDIYPNRSSPDETCDCDKCKISLTPEKNFAHIYILTSTSHVFDQTEGSNTRCEGGYGMVDNLSGTHPVSSDVETDRSQLVFVTHDSYTSRTFKIFWEHFLFLKEKIQDTIFPNLSANPVSIKIRENGYNTIGKCVEVDTHLVYTNEVEKDEVGTPVIVLGKKYLHCDVSAHTGQYPLDPKYGYSRYLDYQYKLT